MTRHQEMARKLPSNEALERELVSALLYGHKDSALALDILQESHFVQPIMQRVFLAAKKLHEAGKPIDTVSVADAMDAESLAAVNGLQGLAEISSETYSLYDVEHACRILCAKARQRSLIAMLQKYQEQAWDAEDDVDDLVERVMGDLSAIAKDSPIDDPTDFQAGMDMLAALDNPATVRIFCGIRLIDRTTGGFRPGELIVLTAETGTGKTLLASQIKRISCRNGHHSLFCNGEMLAAHLRAREISVRSKIRYSKFRNPERLNQFEMDAIIRTVGEGCHKCRIMDGDLTIGRIRSRTRKYREKDGIEFLIVDYDELVEAHGKDEFAEQREVIRNLKSLALELKIPVLLISQLRKALQNEDRNKPTLSRLYGSGSKVKTASVVLYVDRPYVRDLQGDETEARIVVVKNRDGKVGAVPCTFNLETLEFEDLPAETESHAKTTD